MKSVEANEAGETMRVKLAAAEAERDALRDEVKRREAECWAGAEEVVKLRAEVERLRAEGLAIADGQIADRERLERLLRRLVDGIDQWNATVTPIIGRPVDYSWPALEEARAALAGTKP